MDCTRWSQRLQNPNPSTDLTLWYATDYSAITSHNVNADSYQPPCIDPHNALVLPLPQPQPRPPGVDPPYLPPPVNVIYTEQTVSLGLQQSAATAAGSYYPDPNAGWAVAVYQFGSSPNANGATPNPAIQSQRRNNEKKGHKKTKVMQSAWCEVCKIGCNSKGVLDQHKLGKKHKKNLEKLKGTTTTPGPSIVAAPPAVIATSPVTLATPHAIVTTAPPVISASPPVVATAPTTLAVSPAAIATSTPFPVSSLAPIDKPSIGPEENPNKPIASNAQKTRKKAAARKEDLETKRRKVLEGGAAADSVRACSICNVVCNSDTVFNYHLAGQKHASMIKKHASHAGVVSAM